VILLLSAISGTRMLRSVTMQMINDCENAATVCNTEAEINLEMRNAVCLCLCSV